MRIQVVGITDNDDGSCTVTVDMEQDALHKFAGIGIVKVFTDAAKEVIDDVDKFVQDVEECPPTPTVEEYINDAIRILERRPQSGEDHATMIDGLVETIQDAINTLVVAKGLLSARES